MTGYATITHNSQAALVAERRASQILVRSQPCYSGASVASLSCQVRLTTSSKKCQACRLYNFTGIMLQSKRQVIFVSVLSAVGLHS